MKWGDMCAQANLQHSYSNFHAMGVNYACVVMQPGAVLKIYELPNTEGKLLVAPHSHLYPFAQTLLAGEMYHYEYDWWSRHPEGVTHVLCNYETPLNGGSGKFVQELTGHLETECITRITVGGGYQLQPDRIHSIATVAPTWLVTFQQADVSAAQARTFFPVGDVPYQPDDKLYQPMTPTNLLAMADRMRSALGERKR